MNNQHPHIDRRSFLKSATAVFPLVSTPAGAAAIAPPPQPKQTARSAPELLPAVPEPADLASDTLVHHFRDYFNPPQVQNEFGSLATQKSVSAITSIALPPFACCGVSENPFSSGNLVTCELFLNGQILTNYPPPAGKIAFTWYPHKILRETSVEGLKFTTETFLISKQRVVAERIVVKNESG